MILNLKKYPDRENWRVKMRERILESVRRRLREEPKSRMFATVKDTYNVLKGCNHLCSYCNARNEIMPSLRRNPRVHKYDDGFKVGLDMRELENPSYKKSGDGLIFVCYMGDSMCESMRTEWINKVIEVTRKDPDNFFLWCSKNPTRYNEFKDEFPPNTVLGTTIETNIVEVAERYSDAPPVDERFKAMKELDWHTKFLSIEPKMMCDPHVVVEWVGEMGINIVEVGADNYGNNLPEPRWSEVEELLQGLRKICEIAVEKKGLGRLKE